MTGRGAVSEGPGPDDPVAGFINAVPHAVIIADEHGTILTVNGAAEQLLGYDPGELVGHAVEALVPRDVRAGHAHYRAAFTGAAHGAMQGTTRSLHAICKNGTLIRVVIGISRWESRDGVRQVACLVSSISVTERRCRKS